MRHGLALASAVAAAAFAAGCATEPPRAGDTVQAVIDRAGAPTAEFADADGHRRLESAAGAFGRRPWIARFDREGRLVVWENVLDEAHFAAIVPGMPAQQVRERLGPPARVWGVRYHDQTVWSYRYETPFCQLFHVGLTPGGVVEDTSYGPDPLCDRDERWRFGR
jgi:hypothetical protein